MLAPAQADAPPTTAAIPTRNRDVAIIAADRAVPHGDVVHLIDLVKRAGVRRFAIDVDPGAAARPRPR